MNIIDENNLPDGPPQDGRDYQIFDERMTYDKSMDSFFTEKGVKIHRIDTPFVGFPNKR